MAQQIFANLQLFLQGKDQLPSPFPTLLRQIERWANATPQQCYFNWYNGTQALSPPQTLTIGTFNCASAFTVRALYCAALEPAGTGNKEITANVLIDGNALSVGGNSGVIIPAGQSLQLTSFGTTIVSPGDHTVSISYTATAGATFTEFQRVVEVQAVQPA